MHSTTAVLLAMAGLFAGGPVVLAQDNAAAKQLAAAKENAQKLGKTKPLALFEQDNVLAVGDLPEVQLQRLALALQKEYVIAAKALGFAGEDKPWTGK